MVCVMCVSAFICALGKQIKMSVALHCWSPLFPSPPIVDLPTQARRGRGCLEEEDINTLEHVNSSLYAVCKAVSKNGVLLLYVSVLKRNLMTSHT